MPPPSPDHRPDFMVILGLAPPYTEQDVKHAYLERVRSAHPDRGGDRESFHRIQRAFEQASTYVRFRENRQNWIAAQVDTYVAQEALQEQLASLGAEVFTETIDWLRRSFGDFAELTEKIYEIRLENSKHADRLVDLIIQEQFALPGLKRLSLRGSTLSNASARSLIVLQNLERLDLSYTQVSHAAIDSLLLLPALESLGIEGLSIGWWSRRNIRRKMKAREHKRNKRAALDAVMKRTRSS